MFADLIAQAEGAVEVIEKATGAGWTAGVVAVVVFAMLGAFGYLSKLILDQSAKREERMATEASTERGRFATEKQELERALITLTEKVTEATTMSAATANRTNDCLAEFSSTMKGVNGDIRELCELLKDRALCPRDRDEKDPR